MCTTLPETLITVMGIEKVVAEWRDLGVLLQLLPRSATGERMNPYTSIWTGVQADDGPTSFHLVLLDAGRTRALADPEGRPALRCIRCSACVNVCPVYRQTGGHAYPTVYAVRSARSSSRSSRASAGRPRPCPMPRASAARAPTSALWGSTSADPRPRASEGRPSLPAGPGRTRAPRSRPRLLERRALRACAADGTRALAPRRPRRPPPLAARPPRRLGALPHAAGRGGADVPRVVGGT